MSRNDLNTQEGRDKCRKSLARRGKAWRNEFVALIRADIHAFVEHGNATTLETAMTANVMEVAGVSAPKLTKWLDHIGFVVEKGTVTVPNSGEKKCPMRAAFREHLKEIHDWIKENPYDVFTPTAPASAVDAYEELSKLVDKMDRRVIAASKGAAKGWHPGDKISEALLELLRDIADHPIVEGAEVIELKAIA